jgi:hypothetical protein
MPCTRAWTLGLSRRTPINRPSASVWYSILEYRDLISSEGESERSRAAGDAPAAASEAEVICPIFFAISWRPLFMCLETFGPQSPHPAAR